MKNPRISPKERGLIKGALRRVFSRSELRRAAVAASIVDYIDTSRPRVKKWSRCPLCKQYIPTYLLEVDHVLPIVPVDSALEHMDWDTIVDRIWCEPLNLIAICAECHKLKTQAESKERREIKKRLKK